MIWLTFSMLRVLPHIHLRDSHHVISVTCVTTLIWSKSPSWLLPHDLSHDGGSGHQNEDYSEIIPRLILNLSVIFVSSSHRTIVPHRGLHHMIWITLRDVDHVIDTTSTDPPFRGCHFSAWLRSRSTSKVVFTFASTCTNWHDLFVRVSGEKSSRKPPFFADYSLIFLLKYNQ